MKKQRYIGLDVHKESIAIVEEGMTQLLWKAFPRNPSRSGHWMADR
jgi:hypothetical protein